MVSAKMERDSESKSRVAVVREIREGLMFLTRLITSYWSHLWSVIPKLIHLLTLSEDDTVV